MVLRQSVIVNSIKYFINFLYGFYQLAKLKSRYPDLGIETPTVIKFDNIDIIIIGKGVHIGPFSEIVAFERTPFSPLKGRLIIGDRVVIGKGANIRAGGGEIVIGDNSLFAQDVSLVAANHSFDTTNFYRDQPWDSNRVGVVIGQNVYVGAGVVVLPGVLIGENSVIAAGSVVTKNVPRNQIWAGAPARFIKTI